MTGEDKIPSIDDKEWQEKNELGTIPKTFSYMGLDGKRSQVTAKATIHPGSVFEKLEEEYFDTDKMGIKTLNTKKFSRAVMQTVYGIDGTALNNISENKGADIFNKMKIFAYSLAGINLTEDEKEKEKN